MGADNAGQMVAVLQVEPSDPVTDSISDAEDVPRGTIYDF